MEVLKHKIINSLVLLPLLVLTACNDLYIPADADKPMLVLTARCVEGDTVAVQLSKTVSQLSTDKSELILNDYTYDLIVNNVSQPHDYIVQPGDEIKITARHNTMGTAHGTCTMPKPCHRVTADFQPSLVTVDSVNYDSSSWPTSYKVQFNGILTVEVTDNPAIHDYYSFGFDSYVESPALDSWQNPGFNFWPGHVDLSNEPIFGEHITEFESAFGNNSNDFTCFTDRQFSGGSYKLHIEIEAATIFMYPNSIDKEGKEDLGFEVTLSTISPDTYKWNSFMWYYYYSLMHDMAEVGLAPYMPAYSNVSTGAGIVTAYTPTKIKISLRDFAEEQLAKFLNK